MFNLLFSQLRSLSASTEILEACNWSEERAEELLSFALSTITSVVGESDTTSISCLKESVLERLRSDFSYDEAMAVISLIEQVGDTPDVLKEVEKYEC
jgi:hypothetical protein